MTDTVRYGRMKSEVRAEENDVCRKIVREIGDFGVTQRQTLYVIYLLAMELEDPEQMRSLTEHVRELGGHELFLADSVEDKDDGSTK